MQDQTLKGICFPHPPLNARETGCLVFSKLTDPYETINPSQYYLLKRVRMKNVLEAGWALAALVTNNKLKLHYTYPKLTKPNYWAIVPNSGSRSLALGGTQSREHSTRPRKITHLFRDVTRPASG